MVVSGVLHLVLLGLFGGLLETLPRREVAPGVRPQPWRPEMQVVEVPPEVAAAAPAVEPVAPPSERARARVDTARVTPPGAPDVGREVMTNAERLRPRAGDRRLWLPPVEGPLAELEAARQARAEEALRDLLRVWMDSLQLSAEQRRAAREWVVEEGDKKWGVSPEGIHLGDITIPLPLGQLFSEGGEKAREAQQALQDFRMIRQQALDQAAAAERKERLEAIRERTREELERRRRGQDDAADDDSTDAGSDTSSVSTPGPTAQLEAGLPPALLLTHESL